jgi:hypothetical protein
MLGVDESTSAIVLPSWLFTPGKKAEWGDWPVKCEWGGGVLVGASAFAENTVISGRAVGLGIDRPVEVSVKTHKEPKIDHALWARYCMSHTLSATEVNLPIVTIGELHRLAADEEWMRLMPELTRMAMSVLRPVKEQAYVEYHCWLDEKEMQEIIDSYLLSNKMRRLIDRSTRLTSLGKVDIYRFFRAAIRRDLTDTISAFVGDVRNGRGLRRLARSHPGLSTAEIQRIASQNYSKPVTEQQVADAIAFMSPLRVPSITVTNTREWDDIKVGEDFWPLLDR